MSSGPLCLLLAVVIGFSWGLLVRSPRIGEMRQKDFNLIIKCFERYSKQNKRVYAQTQGNVAKLYDENGQEIICDDKPRDHYDQHCFFSPLNCFFTTLRLHKQQKS